MNARGKVQLRLPAGLREAALAQAAAQGVSLNLFVAAAVAARVGAQAEATRYFAARAARTTPGRVQALLAQVGMEGDAGEGDEVG